ncbi:hypothetical protein [Streptomyces sp. NPDC059063]|uniref:hypothetical protein n=1 Tax=unclassified Streptomyces TaxID=2593676 RepID=UPI0036B3568E
MTSLTVTAPRDRCQSPLFNDVTASGPAAHPRPGSPGAEWAACCDELTAVFGIIVESAGPDFGVEHLLDTIAGSSTPAAFVSEQTALVLPVTTVCGASPCMPRSRSAPARSSGAPAPSPLGLNTHDGTDRSVARGRSASH